MTEQSTETKELLARILNTPANTAAFSYIRYVGTHLSQEEQAEFLNGLLQKAVESREAGDASALWDYLEEWEERGRAVAGARARGVEVEGIPWTPFTVPLNRAKFALITTGGFYVEGQEPYETDGPEGMGDWSWRAIPKDVPRHELRLAHLHYDLSGPHRDFNCVFPLDRMVELERDGVIGSLAGTNYSFMGYIQRPDLLSAETAPQVAKRLKADGVQAVVLTST